MTKITDLDLTDAIDQAARQLLGDVDYQAMSPTHLMSFKQRVLETVLPVLPSVIDQVEKLTREQIAAAIRADVLTGGTYRDSIYRGSVLERAAEIAEGAS